MEREKKIIAPILINFVYSFSHGKKEKCVSMEKEKKEKAKRRFVGKTFKKIYFFFFDSLQLFSHVTQLKEGKGRNLTFLDFLLFRKKSLKRLKKISTKCLILFSIFEEDILIKNGRICFIKMFFLLFDLSVLH